MAIKLEINITNKWLYSLIAFGILLALGVGAVFAYNNIPNPGHGADTVVVTINGQEKTVQQAIDELHARATYPYQSGYVNGDTVSELLAGRKYLISVYGIIRNTGGGNNPLGSVAIIDCNSSSTILAQTPSFTINWPDGNAPQSATLFITAPASQCIKAFTDHGFGNIPAKTIMWLELP